MKIFTSTFIVYSNRKPYPTIERTYYRSGSLLIISLAWYGYTLNFHIDDFIINKPKGNK